LSDFAPHLKKIVTLCRKKASLLSYEKHPYDALLDLYEPGMTSSYLDPLFERLKPSLTHLLQRIKDKGIQRPELSIHEFPAAKQMHFGKFLLKSLGFSEEMSRLDLSSHPFCNALCPSDVRMTTRIIPNNPLSSIFSVIHEAGHGIYEAQLEEKYFGTPLGSSISLGLHESQSRLWETIFGKSYPFWEHFYPFLQKEFPDQLTALSLDDFFCNINHVTPSLIRTESDEVTYCLHVILRYELEKGLIEGSIEVEDLPNLWNDKMRQYLGVSPSCDAEGCLQDIHWSMGGLGYFPTYALGNLYAAQFFECFAKCHPNWAEQIKHGNLEFIKEWLKEHLHKHGRRYTPHEIVQKITGRPLEEKPYINYLESKFKKIYNF
jgi:carboxypeptidase Taq